MLAALQALIKEVGGLCGAFGGVLSVESTSYPGHISDLLITLLIPIANTEEGTGGVGPLLSDLGTLLVALGNS